MNLESLLTNRFLRFIFPFVILIVFWVFIKPLISTNTRENADKERCETAALIKEKSIIGVVIAKYRDKRNLRHFAYRRGKVRVDNSFFVLEGSDTYDHIQVGDSIIKEKGSFVVTLIRQDSVYTHTLDYGCK